MTYVYVTMGYDKLDSGELLGVSATPDGAKKIAEDNAAATSDTWENDWRESAAFEGSYRRNSRNYLYFAYREEVQP